MENEEHEKKRLKKEAIKARTWSVAHLETILNCMETEKSLLMKTSKSLISFWSQTTTRSNQDTDKVL